MKPGDRVRSGIGAGRRPFQLFLGALLLWSVASLAVRIFGVQATTLLAQRPRPEIESVLALGPHEGDCDRCHAPHGDGPITYPDALVGPNDNTLCAGCHAVDWAGPSYPGTIKYTESSHGTNSSVVWPGPTPPPRTEPLAAGKCLNCHDPHGQSDASGATPALTLAREEALCLNCHDGSPATTNVRIDAQKAWRHPTLDSSGRHGGAGESSPADFAVTPLNRRHAECEDCHNPHLAQGGGGGGGITPGLPAALRGVSRLLVQNGPAGTTPAFTFIPGSDTLTTPQAEYQLCFKCHSSWTTQPSGQTDLARVLNPANPSYHPVEAPGQNLNINPGAFEMGWNAGSLTACGDCHGSESGLVRGPHGSSYRYILNRPYQASAQPRTMSSNELCFACHSYDVYGNPDSPESVQSASRFNAPNADKGHAEHVGDRDVSCYSCHVTHGSTTLPHLLVLGRSPGIISYTRTSNGGSCTATCHGSESYQVNYAR